MGSLRPRTVAKPSSPLELVNSTLSTSHTPDMHSVIFCVSAEYLQTACEQRGEPPLASERRSSVRGSVRGAVRGSVRCRAARVISVGSASVGAAATGAGASSGATRPFWYIWGGAAGAAGAASPGASSANDGSTTAHKLPASIARREVGLPHGRSVRPDAAESSAQSTRLDLMGRAVPAQRGGRCGPRCSVCHCLSFN